MNRKIVTHADFDGIVCASICSFALGVGTVIFTGPTRIARADVPISGDDIVCDLPYPLQCGLWFDHHPGNLEEVRARGIDPESIPGEFNYDASCSRIVYRYFSSQVEMPDYFAETVRAADLIDSFSYGSIEEWQAETPENIINNSLKTSDDDRRQKIDYMRRLVESIRENPLGVVAESQEVQDRYKRYKDDKERMLRLIQDSSYFLPEDTNHEVVVVDLTKYARRANIIKALSFLVYPEARCVLEVANLYFRGTKSNDLTFSASLSLNLATTSHSKDIGEIMRELNLGDGHPGAASGRLSCGSKKEMLKEKERILRDFFRLWSSQK